MILPNSANELVASLIRHHHTKNYHCSALESFYLIRQQFYILGGKESVRGVARIGVPCRKVAKLPRNQKMGDLKIVQVVGFVEN